MSATQREREDFLLAMQREGVPADVARKVLRLAATHCRLQEAQCNGDYPADNGERPTVACEKCEAAWSPSAFFGKGEFHARCYSCDWKGAPRIKRGTCQDEANGHKQATSDTHGTGIVTTRECPDCRIERLIRTALAPFNVEPVFQGDPRGVTVKLKVPSGRTDDWGQEGLCVPA